MSEMKRKPMKRWIVHYVEVETSVRHGKMVYAAEDESGAAEQFAASHPLSTCICIVEEPENGKKTQ